MTNFAGNIIYSYAQLSEYMGDNEAERTKGWLCPFDLSAFL
jgi:hypothetical protein